MAITIESTKNSLQQSLNGTLKAAESVKQNASHPIPLSQYQSVDRVLSLPAVKNTQQLYEERIEPLIERLPLGHFALNTTKNVLALTQNKVVVPLATRFVEPYHDFVDATGMRVLDGAEQVVGVVVGVENRVLTQVDGVVSVVERVVNWALPAQEDEQDQDQGVDVSADPQVVQQAAPFAHAYSLTLKTGHRLYQLVARTAHSEHTLNLRNTLDLLNQYIVHLQEASNRLRESLQQSQQFLAQSIEKRVGTKEEREKLLDSTKQHTVEMVMSVQHKLIESATEVKTVIVSLLHSLNARLDSLPFGVKQKVEVLIHQFKAKWDKLSLTFSAPTKKNVAQNGESADDMLTSLRQLTGRATDLNALSAEGLEILSRVRSVVDSYYTYYLKGADKALKKREEEKSE